MKTYQDHLFSHKQSDGRRVLPKWSIFTVFLAITIGPFPLSTYSSTQTTGVLYFIFCEVLILFLCLFANYIILLVASVMGKNSYEHIFGALYDNTSKFFPTSCILVILISCCVYLLRILIDVYQTFVGKLTGNTDNWAQNIYFAMFLAFLLSLIACLGRDGPNFCIGSIISCFCLIYFFIYLVYLLNGNLKNRDGFDPNKQFKLWNPGKSGILALRTILYEFSYHPILLYCLRTVGTISFNQYYRYTSILSVIIFFPQNGTIDESLFLSFLLNIL